MIALGMFAFVGCQEYGIDSQPEAAANVQDDALETYVMAAESAASVVFNISANTPWRIERSADAQWLNVTPSMSATSSLVSEVTITADNNETFSPRSATLTITAGALEGWSKVITVNQLSKGDFLMTEWAEDIEAEGGVATYYIYTNKAWEYRAVTSYLEAEGDLSGEDADDIVTYELRINVPANTGMAREAHFMVRAADGDHEFTIHQIGMELRLADGQNTTFESYAPGDELTFAVKANVPWTAAVDESCADWLEITNIDSEANTVTVITKGDISQYIGKRTGIVNLTSTAGVSNEIELYQPSAFIINWSENTTANNRYTDNGDQTITLYPGTLEGRGVYLATVSSLKLSEGKKWVCEIDTERTNIEKLRLFCQIDQTGLNNTSSWTNGVSHLTLTPDFGTQTGLGYNNHFAHNGGTWSGVVQPWNLDGLANGGTTYYEGEFFDAEDIKKLEKIEFEMTPVGLKLSVTANGKELSFTRLLEWIAEGNRGTFSNNYHQVELIPAFGVIGAPSSASYTDEYITITKCYITAAE